MTGFLIVYGVSDGLRAEDQKIFEQMLKQCYKHIKAGQKIQYVIMDYSRKTKRAVPLSMAENKYEVKRHTKLLADWHIAITRPFGMEIIP